MVLKQGQDAFEERYRLKTRGVYLNVISKHVSVLLDMPVEEILFKGLAFRNRHRQSVLRGKALAKEGGYHLNQAYFYIDKVNMHVNFAGVMREIIFYETASGQKPIEKFIDQLSAKQAQKTPKADIEIAEDRKNDYFRRKMK